MVFLLKSSVGEDKCLLTCIASTGTNSINWPGVTKRKNDFICQTKQHLWLPFRNFISLSKVGLLREDILLKNSRGSFLVYSFEEEFGNNTFDIRHSANFTALYELPFGKGQKYELGGISDVLLGGWQVGTVYNGRSGSPLDIRITRPDTVFQCNNAAGCVLGGTNVANGFVVSALPTGTNSGFIAVLISVPFAALSNAATCGLLEKH